MAGPFVGKDGKVLFGAVEVGYMKECTIDVDADALKDYAWGSQKPQILKQGNLSFKWKCSKMFIDSTHANEILAGAAVTIHVRPEGSGAGKEDYQLDSAQLLHWGYSHPQNGVILEDVSGEAMGLTPTKQAS